MPPDRRAARRAAAAAACLLLGATAAPAADPIPRPLRIRAEATSGSFASVRDDVRDAARDAILRERCFASVDLGDIPLQGEVLLTIRLSGVLRETRQGRTLADKLNPRDPSSALNVESRFEADVDAALTTGDPPASVRRFRFHVARAYRPLLESEDPEQRAYDEAVDDAAREIARRVCKSPRDLLKRLDAARASAR